MALIPPFFLDCVVALGNDDQEGSRQWTASGFLYGHLLKSKRDTNEYNLYLVTNRHVLEGQSQIYLRFNPVGASPAQEYLLEFGRDRGFPECVLHPDPEIDLAVVQLDGEILVQDNIQFNYFLSDTHLAAGKALEDIGITEGDFVYVLGFPMGLVGERRSFVIVRQGTIARIRDYLAGVSKEILLDCMIFPGNSGGPVVTKPETTYIEGTKAPEAAYLIGIVAGFIPYTETAVSPQTGRPRVMFEENSGLAVVVPVEYLVELVKGLG